MKNLDKERLALLAEEEQKASREANAKEHEELQHKLLDVQRQLELSQELFNGSETAKQNIESSLRASEAFTKKMM